MIKQSFVILMSLALVWLLGGCSSPEEKATEYLNNANALRLEGNLNKAVIEYKNALQINQNLPDAWYGLAKVHEIKQEWRQAYATLTKIREVNPEHIEGRIMLGQLLLASNQLDQALIDAKDVLQMAADNSRSHSLMAAVQFRLGNIAAAQQYVERALALDSTNSEATLVLARLLIAAEEYDQALHLLDRAINNRPVNLSLYLMKIQVHRSAGDDDAIKRVYTELIDKFPTKIGFRQALARIYLQDESLEMAEKELRKIVEIVPAGIEEKLQLISFIHRYRSVEAAITLVKQYIEQTDQGFKLRFKLGELHEANNQFEAAAEIYQGIVTDDGLQPNGLEAKNKIALLNVRQGDYDSAQLQVDEVLALDKNNENGLLLRAGFNIKALAHDQAIVDLRTILRDNPRSVKALGLLGQAYSASGAGELAIKTYAKAFELGPGNPVIANTLASSHLRRNRVKQADGILQESVRNGNASLDAIKLLTQVKLSLGDWDEAERLAHRLKQIEGEEALSAQILGFVFRGRDQQERSIDAFRRAHELAPEASRPMVSLVQTYLRGKKILEAKRFLKAVLADNPENVTAYMLLGQLSLIEQDIDAAIGYFSQLIEVNPKLAIGYRGLASVYSRRKDHPQAEKILLKGLELLPASTALQIDLASVYERGQNFDQAISLYESLLSKNAEFIVARNNLASLLSDHRSDRQSLERARDLALKFKNSKIPQFRDTYAWVAVQSNINLGEAVLMLEKIVDDNQQVGIYRYHLGEAYRKTGKAEQASQQLTKVIELVGAESELGLKAGRQLQQLKL